MTENSQKKSWMLLEKITSFRAAGRILKNCKIGEPQAEIDEAVPQMEKDFEKWRDEVVTWLREHCPYDAETFLNIYVTTNLEDIEGRNAPHKRCRQRLGLHLEKLEKISKGQKL